MSQVRSLTLDSLKPGSIRLLRSIGNTKANTVYEALLPKDFDKSSLRRDGRQDFILEKYVSMKYTSAEDKERILMESKWVVGGWVGVAGGGGGNSVCGGCWFSWCSSLG